MPQKSTFLLLIGYYFLFRAAILIDRMPLMILDDGSRRFSISRNRDIDYRSVKCRSRSRSYTTVDSLDVDCANPAEWSTSIFCFPPDSEKFLSQNKIPRTQYSRHRTLPFLMRSLQWRISYTAR